MSFRSIFISACLALVATLFLGGGRAGAVRLIVTRTPAIVEIDEPVGPAAETSTSALASRVLPHPPVSDFLTNFRLNDPGLTPAGAWDITPAVAAMGDKVVVVWYVRGPSAALRLRAAYSMDAGATFTDAEWLPPLPVNWRWGIDPCIESDPQTDRFFIAAQTADPTDNKMGVAFVSLDLQNGGNLEWGDPAIVIETAPYQGAYFTDQLSMKFDVTLRSLRLVYRNNFDASGPLTSIVSTDGGANWSPPETILSDATGTLGNLPRVGFSDFGSFVTHLDFSGWDQTALRSNRLISPGTWGAPTTAASFRQERTSVPGSMIDGYGGTTLAVDRTFARFQNRAYAAWIAGAEFPTWPQPSGYVLTEFEPNDTPAQANSAGGVPSAASIQGAFSPLTEADWFVVTLAQGQHLVVRPESITLHSVNGQATVEWYAADGVHGMGAASFLPGDVGTGRMMITAPVAGNYYLRVTGFETDAYAFSLAYSSLFTFPRDRRELYTAYSDDHGASWSAPVPLYVGGIGYDLLDPTLAVGNDGRPYLFWHDYSDASLNGMVSAARMSRSSDGGLSWETPKTLATASSDWQPLAPNSTAFKIGWRIGAATTPQNIGELAVAPARNAPDAVGPAPATNVGTPDEWMHVLWTDARDGETNIYGTRFSTGFDVIYRTNDTTAVPGQTIGLRLVVENRNQFFPQVMAAYPHVIQRNWPAISQSFTVDPEQRWVGYPIVVTVPDTAAAGSVFVQSAWDLGPTAIGMNTFIHVTSTVGVTPGDGVAAALEFAAPSPNPARSQTTFRMTLPADTDATLEVFDVRGARVRSVYAGRAAAGAIVRTWDLTDDAGRRVAPGLYLARAHTAASTQVRRVAVVE